MKPMIMERRRFAVLFAAAVVVLAAPLGSSAQDAVLKIGFVDSGKIFEQYEGAKDAQRALERESREWEARAQALKDSLQATADELESQRLMLSQERLRSREEAVSALRKTYEDYVTSIWGESGKLSQRNAELTKPIIDRVNSILHTIAQQEGFSLVLDAAGGTIVYATPALDLTERVLTELNKEGETGKQAPKK